MFSRKKKLNAMPESTASSADAEAGERRKHYRVRPRATQPIRASLQREAGPTIRGQCVELSIGGAGVEFEGSQESKLPAGRSCSPGLHTESQADGVKGTKRVGNVLPPD